MIILRPFGGKSDLKWRCDTTYKSVYGKSEMVPPPLKHDQKVKLNQIKNNKINVVKYQYRCVAS